jgi:hypothetical protein
VREFVYEKVAFAKFAVSSREMVADLSRYGIVPRKTATVGFPTLPRDLERHFIRGYFDGDGGFSISANGHPSKNVAFRVIGNLAFIQALQAVLMRECALRATRLSQRRVGQPVWTLTYTGRTQVGRIVEYLYDEATLFLPRKHDYVASYLIGARNIAAKYRGTFGKTVGVGPRSIGRNVSDTGTVPVAPGISSRL